jgi:Ig-like domain CHU_C associated
MTRQLVAILGVLLFTQVVAAQAAELGRDGAGAGALRVHAAADCVAASITTQPQSQSIGSGQTATLSVSAAGSTPISYQWYQGTSGDRSQPVGGDANTFTTPALTSTTSYWVLVANSCGGQDSSAATVTVGPATGIDVWVPVVAHNPGLNQSQWRSDIGLLNTGGTAAEAQLKFFGGGAVATTTVPVPAETQSILADVVGQLGASGQGALEVISDQPLKVTARVYNQVAPSATCYPTGTQGQDYPAVADSDGLATGQSAYLAGLTENGSYRSNIGLVDTGTGDAAVLVELFDGAGDKLTDYTVSLSAGQWVQETEPFKNKAGQADVARGYARITVQSGSGVFAFASVVDDLTNDPTTVVMQR